MHPRMRSSKKASLGASQLITARGRYYDAPRKEVYLAEREGLCRSRLKAISSSPAISETTAGDRPMGVLRERCSLVEPEGSNEPSLPTKMRKDRDGPFAFLAERESAAALIGSTV